MANDGPIEVDTFHRKAPTAKPIFELIPKSNKISVNRGSTANIDVLITGYGEFERHKLSVLFNLHGVLDSDDPGEIEVPLVDQGDDGAIYGKPAIGHPDQVKQEIDPSGATMYLPLMIFYDDPEAGEWNEEMERNNYPRIVGEAQYGNRTFLRTSMNVASDAPPGDYNIAFALLYSDKLDAYQSVASVTIHVKSRAEELEVWSKWAAIAAVLIALSALLANVVISLYSLFLV